MDQNQPHTCSYDGCRGVKHISLDDLTICEYFEKQKQTESLDNFLEQNVDTTGPRKIVTSTPPEECESCSA